MKTLVVQVIADYLKPLAELHSKLVNDSNFACRITEGVMILCLTIIIPYATYACCFLNPKATVSHTLDSWSRANPLIEILLFGFFVHVIIKRFT
jgi:hypothetical protein